MKRTVLGLATVVAASFFATGSLAQTQDELIAGAKSEGPVLLYVTHGPTVWTPIIEGFNKVYPSIKVETIQLGGGEIWERLRAETASKVRTADIIVGGTSNQFVIAADKGELLDYKPKNLDALIKNFPIPVAGVVPLAIDVMSIIYNKVKLPEALWPKSFDDLADKASKNPDVFKGKVATWDPMTSGLGINFSIALNRDYGEAYLANLGKLAPSLKFEGGAFAMLDKVTSGEYVAAYIISRSVIRTMNEARQKIVGWVPFGGPEPVNVVSLAIPKMAKNINSAKLLADYLVTAQAQEVGETVGFYAIHPEAKGELTLTKLLTDVKKVSIYGHGREFLTFEKDLLPRINALFGK